MPLQEAQQQFYQMLKKEIELTETRNTQVRDDIHMQEISQRQSQSQQSKIQSVRKHQPLGLYIAVMLCQIITIFLSALLSAIPATHKMYTYIVFMVMTLIRSTIFVYNSIRLVPSKKKLLLLYFLLDNTFLMMVASVVTYIFLNKDLVQVHPTAIGAMISYPILLICLCGNFRVMLLYCDWKKWQVIGYKMVKIIASTYFLVYGTILIIKSPDGTESDLFMLWVFTTCGFWAQMCFCINSFDQSDGLSTKYLLSDD